MKLVQKAGDSLSVSLDLSGFKSESTSKKHGFHVHQSGDIFTNGCQSAKGEGGRKRNVGISCQRTDISQVFLLQSIPLNEWMNVLGLGNIMIVYNIYDVEINIASQFIYFALLQIHRPFQPRKEEARQHRRHGASRRRLGQYHRACQWQYHHHLYWQPRDVDGEIRRARPSHRHSSIGGRLGQRR